MNDIDIAAYFERIGHRGGIAPTYATLAALHRLHPAAIPFENLDPFLAQPVDLSAQALQEKLIRQRRGGYCFEHNLLFMHVLSALGFTVSGLGARVLWGQPEDAVTRRTHMLIRVELDGETFLTDVGFGGLTQTAPLRFSPGVVQETPHENFRIADAGGGWRMQASVGGDWRTLYCFDLSEHFQVDYEISNYFLSTHPSSLFITGLMIARALPDRRLALGNNRLSIHHLGGPTEQRRLETAVELADTIETSFDIEISDRPGFERVVAAKGILGTAA
jgi:N-hydroxyarylamine O-acetyltransferase